MDTDTYIMWITPLEKNSYINSDTFYVETRGLAIRNPTTSGSINKNLFVVKYYTWEGDVEPDLDATGDYYVFFRQDSSFISSSTLSYSSTYYPPHSSVSVPKDFYSNEFEPADTYSGTDKMKTPF